MFNYQNLEAGQFEELCCDIMQARTGRQLHVFASGQDGGVDLTDDSKKHTIVVQVKHYEKSGFSALKRTLEREVGKVRKIAPEQYYVCVSQRLTDANVYEIYKMFSGYMDSTNNILTLDDIDSFLHEPENIQITRKHTKLWLESGMTLQLLLECFPKLDLYLGNATAFAAPQLVYPKCFTTYIPVGPEVGLIGRDDVLERVRTMLDSEKSVALVSGLGGIGKSAVMAQICNNIMTEDRKDTYVAWITCSDSFIDDLLTIRQPLGIPKELKREEVYEAIIRKLQILQGTLYLFLDDMVRMPDEEELGTYNALRPNVHVMITSRHEIKGIPYVDLHELKKNPVVEMFYDYYGKDMKKEYVEDAWEIINSDSVRNHTLLVELLAKAAGASFGTLADFRRKLEENGFLDVSNHRFDTGRFDNNTIKEIVARLYDISELTEEQQRVMRLFSIFTPGKVIYKAIVEWPAFDAVAVDGLVKLGWLVRTDNGFIIHQIIKNSLAEQVGGELKIEDYGRLMDRVIETDKYIPEELEYTKVNERLILLEDVAKYLGDRTEEMLDYDNLTDGDVKLLTDSGLLFNNIACIYKNQCEYNKALEFYWKAYARYERVFSNENPMAAMIYNNVALVYSNKGEYNKALEYYEKACLITERIFGLEHPHTALIYKNMGDVYGNQGNYSKELEYYRKALVINERVLGPEHTDTATIYNSMAVTFSEQGDYNKALEYYKKALIVFEQALGIDHPDTATAYGNIAEIFRAQGDYNSAIKYNSKALTIRERVLGYNHPSTAVSYNNLAAAFSEQGYYNKALKLSRKALEICERILGFDHPITATTYNNMAFAYSNLGDYKKSQEYYGKSLAIRERLLGIDHPDTAKVYNNMAFEYYAQGEYSNAIEYFGKAIAIWEHVLGTDHPDTATMFTNIAEAFCKQGNYSKAMEYNDKALSILNRVLASEHPSMATIYNNIGSVFYAQDEYNNAQEYFEKALMICEHTIGFEHPKTATTYNNMAAVFRARGEYQKALEYYEKALAIRIKKMGEDHPFTQDVQSSIKIMNVLILLGINEAQLRDLVMHKS